MEVTVVGRDPARAATTDRVTTFSLIARLRRAPGQREVETVPMILPQPDFRDDEELREVIANSRQARSRSDPELSSHHGVAMKMISRTIV